MTRAERTRRRMIGRQRDAVRRGVCQVCGCTETHACPGGCAWANAAQTICTACAFLPEQAGAQDVVLELFG